ncbi:hypothetical protein O0L34_g7999 [Tuta absoluta]|nr:hypothetical protein O0L34_g7999 [Tuta absoluta]
MVDDDFGEDDFEWALFQPENQAANNSGEPRGSSISGEEESNVDTQQERASVYHDTTTMEDDSASSQTEVSPQDHGDNQPPRNSSEVEASETPPPPTIGPLAAAEDTSSRVGTGLRSLLRNVPRVDYRDYF